MMRMGVGLCRRIIRSAGRCVWGRRTFPGLEFLYRDAEGQETWYRVASLPLRWENGTVAEVLGIFQNIDAEKSLLTIQQRINIELEQRVQEEMAARQAAQQRGGPCREDACPGADRWWHRA